MSHKPELNSSAGKSAVILISGRGSNLLALLNADLENCRITAVISNKPNVEGLNIATRHGIPTHVLNHRDYPDREAFDTALASAIDQYQPDLVILAGFMRILTTGFVTHYQGRLINIHPSLLPAYSGLNTHERALEDGVKIHGCTVHFVTPELDHGPIIIQAAVSVLMDDTPSTLAARVLHEEHRIYPQAVRWFCSGNLSLDRNGKVALNRLKQPAAALISPALE
jgi:phosphoribosylglycinamide formyltransferase-1